MCWGGGGKEEREDTPVSEWAASSDISRSYTCSVMPAEAQTLTMDYCTRGTMHAGAKAFLGFDLLPGRLLFQETLHSFGVYGGRVRKREREYKRENIK